MDEQAPSLAGKSVAVEQYRLGVEHLEQGVALHLPQVATVQIQLKYKYNVQDPNDPSLVRAHTLRSKMLANLATAR